MHTLNTYSLFDQKQLFQHIKINIFYRLLFAKLSLYCTQRIHITNIIEILVSDRKNLRLLLARQAVLT